MASGMKRQAGRVFGILSEFGPQDLTEIFGKASLLMPSLSRIIRKLREDELIIWATNPEDRRRQTVVIASAGQQITDDNLVLAPKIAGDFQHRLGADRFELLLDLLAELEQKKLNLINI